MKRLKPHLKELNKKKSSLTYTKKSTRIDSLSFAKLNTYYIEATSAFQNQALTSSEVCLRAPLDDCELSKPSYLTYQQIRQTRKGIHAVFYLVHKT